MRSCSADERASNLSCFFFSFFVLLRQKEQGSSGGEPKPDFLRRRKRRTKKEPRHVQFGTNSEETVWRFSRRVRCLDDVPGRRSSGLSCPGPVRIHSRGRDGNKEAPFPFNPPSPQTRALAAPPSVRHSETSVSLNSRKCHVLSDIPSKPGYP